MPNSEKNNTDEMQAGSAKAEIAIGTSPQDPAQHASSDDTLAETTPVSETIALQNICEWSVDRPNWQRDALRRLITGGATLSEVDINDLHALCLDETKAFEPLTGEHLATNATAGHPISLISISNPVGINALVDDQGVEFSPTGLTVVYGTNAAGKSGYVRILKNACRSRDNKFKVLPDIGKPQVARQAARITYLCGSEQQDYDWEPGRAPHPHLTAVSIFDSRSATTHLSGQHDVAYTPFPMEVLGELALACDGIKTKIEAKKTALEEQAPVAIKDHTLNPETAAGAFLDKISSETKLTELENLVTLSPEEETIFAQLQVDLASDPEKQIAALTSQRRRLAEHSAALNALFTATSSAAFLRRDGLLATFEKKRELAVAASEKLFSASPLPDIGGDLWRELWEAARAYSDNQAKPELSFPDAKADEDLCVLCQQPLGKDAIERWDTFEEFIKGTTKFEQDAAKQELDAWRTATMSVGISRSAARDAHLLAGKELGDQALADNLRKSWVFGMVRLRALLKERPAPIDAIPVPVVEIEAHLKKIDDRVNLLSTEVDSDQRKKIIREFEGLRDRIALRTIKKDVEAHIVRLSEIKKLKAAARRAAKNTVTMKNKELSDALVTDALRGRFHREAVTKLDIGSAPVELKKAHDKSGQSYFHVVLVDRPDQPLGEILSEGEHRCVALAAFLAELVTAKEYSGIVFDDPMSSLDHNYRHRVAKRLVEEAEHRQVIIFTHDLVFLSDVANQAETQGRPVKFQTVRRSSRGPGIVEDGAPFRSMNANEMENSIRSELKNLKGSFDQMKESNRSTLATGIIGKIRSAWEQAAADFVQPVLRRYEENVRPSGLRQFLMLDDTDVTIVEKARGRLSKAGELHSSPEAIDPGDVSHKGLVDELNILRDWLATMRSKRDKKH